MKTKTQLSVNIKDLDLKIGKLNDELDNIVADDEKYEQTIKKIERLTDLRCKLAESKVNGSVKTTVVSSLLGIASLVIVLKYEEKDVITSKALNMLPGMFRGGK